MMPVSLRSSLENLFRQEPFSPERHQSFRIKVPGMYAPESHDFLTLISADLIVPDMPSGLQGINGVFGELFV